MSNSLKPDYDEDPVIYCKRCFSLKIKYEESIDSDCCAECGCSDVAEAPIEEWEKKYIKRYGHPYVLKGKDPKKTYLYKMSISELKEEFFKRTEWVDIIKTMYPRFPLAYGKVDSTILFFDRVLKDKRLDELKLLLLNQSNFNNYGNLKKQGGGNATKTSRKHSEE